MQIYYRTMHVYVHTYHTGNWYTITMATIHVWYIIGRWVTLDQHSLVAFPICCLAGDSPSTPRYVLMGREILLRRMTYTILNKMQPL